MAYINNLFEKRISVRSILIIIGFFIVMMGFVLYFTFGGIQEGFQAGLIGISAAIDYKMGDGVKKSWENKDTHDNNHMASAMKGLDIGMELHNSETNVITDSDNIYSDLEKNEGDQVPLSGDKMLVFETNKFSPDCCPSDYSNADGCVCATPEQMKYLNERGGNRTLTSEY